MLFINGISNICSSFNKSNNNDGCRKLNIFKQKTFQTVLIEVLHFSNRLTEGIFKKGYLDVLLKHCRICLK